MITLQTDRLYSGPSLLDMASLLPLSTEPVTASWTNTKAERSLLRRYPDRSFLLVVPDPPAMERAATTLGLRFNLDPGAKVELARSINTTAGGKWRTIATQCGPTVSRGAMVQIVADHIRKGNDAPPLRKLLVECLLEGTTAVDFDVLLGLRMQGARV